MNIHKWRDAVLSPGGPGTIVTRAVLCGIAKHANRKTGECWPSVKTLAKNLGSNRQTVADHIAVAVEAGWLQKVERDGKSHVFLLTFPDEGANKPSTAPAKEIGTPGTEGCQGDWRGVPTKLAGGAKEIGTNTFKNTPENTSTTTVPTDGTETNAVREVQEESTPSPSSNTTDSDHGYGSAPADPLGQPTHKPKPWPKPSALPRANNNPIAHRVYPVEFEGVWAAYPDRDGGKKKAAAYEAVRRLVARGVEPFQLEAAADAFREHQAARDKVGTEFVPMAATWFNGEDWRDYVGRESGSFKREPAAKKKKKRRKRNGPAGLDANLRRL